MTFFVSVAAALDFSIESQLGFILNTVISQLFVAIDELLLAKHETIVSPHVFPIHANSSLSSSEFRLYWLSQLSQRAVEFNNHVYIQRF